MSCLLSARETLFAGLTAAGGALFAAWIAWSAVRDQTEFEMARDAAAREDRARGQVTRAKMEIEGSTDRRADQQTSRQFQRPRGVFEVALYVDDLRTLSA